MPEQVTVYEVGPRDGLQNEEKKVPTEQKVHLIERLADAGLTHVESTSFVHPKWVPQMADAADVMDTISRQTGVSYPVLIPNRKGLKRALECGVDDIAVFAAASETFSEKNLNCSIKESLDRFGEVVDTALNSDLSVRGYVSCVAGCPYEGEIEPGAVRHVSSALYEMGCSEISLGDTIGVGTPNNIEAVIDEVKTEVPVKDLALHCHDTYGQALVNIYAGLQKGISTIDSSVGGLGGCPYADGATGNVATEDVLYFLDGMGIETGIDLEQIVDIAHDISEVLDRSPDSRVAHALRDES